MIGSLEEAEEEEEDDDDFLPPPFGQNVESQSFR